MATKNRERGTDSADKSGKGGKGEKLQALVEQGKSKGFLTYDEVNDALPADVVADQMDDVMGGQQYCVRSR